jgi:predicted Zn-dependent protease
MRARGPGWVAGIAVVGLLTTGCAVREVTPIGAAGRPFAPDGDERALWARAEQEDAVLRERATVHDDPELERYLAAIGDRLTPDGVRLAGGPGFRFRVLRDPSLSAFALPDGRLYVHTGLLSRVENESQLAMVLAHEMAHVIHRHALAVTREGGLPPIRLAVPAAAVPTGEDLGTAVIGQTARVILGQGLRLAALAAVQGYGPDRERDADATATGMLVRAGYDAREAAEAFAVLQAGLEAGDRLERFLLGRRAELAERSAVTTALLAFRHGAASPGPARDSGEFAERMRPVVREDASENLRAGRFALARRQLDRVLALTPDDALAHLHYGDLHRLQAQRAADAGTRAEHIARALERYQRAAVLDPMLPDPHRQLGLLHYQQGDRARARAAFERYLALGPEAPDARRIEEYLAELDR